MFGGQVESLTTAGIQGVGVRVIVDHRQGYASAGSLEPDVIEETLREARDNAAFGEPDEWYALATPGGGQRCRARRARPVARGARLDADRCESADRARPRSRDESARLPSARCGGDRLRRRARGVGDRQLAGCRGVHPPHDVLGACRRAGRRRFGHADGIRLRRGANACGSRSRVDPARCRRPGGAPPRCEAGRRTAHPDPLRPARDSIRARRAVERVQRRDAAEGPVDVRGTRRREDRGADRRDRRRPDRRSDVRCVRLRQRGCTDPAQRAHRRRRAARLPPQRLHRPPFRWAQHRERGTRRLRVGSGCRRPRHHACGRVRARRKHSWRRFPRLSTSSR